MDKANLQRRMEGALDNLKSEFAGLRTGRASTSMLEPVVVDMYGSKMPMNQVGTVSAPEPRLLTVQVWDANATSAVEKAIRESGLGLNPMAEGTVIRVPIPELNEERRKELTKVAGQYAESARVAIRNVRRDGMDEIKKDGDLSEDDKKRFEKEVQELTDSKVKVVDQMLGDKESDIMTV
ncbi:MAG: ribosome recycling factor [Alphaproteobacteria bacterium]|nr:ribosome recycling factor [Alphaproteobacteria bacterium]